MFGLFGKIKPVKIRGLSGNKKFGVAAKNVKELLDKACKLFQVPFPGARVCLYEDGAIVTEDYFPSLPDNVELVLLSKEETWSGVICDISQLLNTDRHADSLIEAARGLLSDEKSSKRRKILTDLLQNLEDKSELESREEDEDWFSGIDARFKTKSAYMKFNCESRIRGYLKEVEFAAKDIQKAKIREEYEKTSRCLVEMLKCHRYNGSYFDRTDKQAKRLCTQEGWFTCQGSYDEKVCQQLHSINPYSSRENRIVFSTWNLDHRVEKKRTIIPTLVNLLQTHKSKEVNLDYFYQLLFTRKNLKLVHIVCHKKGAHNLQCESKKILRTDKNSKKEAKQIPNVKKQRLI